MKEALYITGLLSLLLNQAGHAQKIRTLFYNDILYGKVKQVSELEYLLGTNMSATDTTWYDEQGNTVERHEKNNNGKRVIEQYIITTDTLGKKLEIDNSEHSQILRGRFGPNGSLIEYSSHSKLNGGLFFKIVYEYDQANNLVLSKRFKWNDILEERRTYKYDQNNRLIAMDVWGEDRQREYHTDYEYVTFDKAGNWTKLLRHVKLQANMGTNEGVVERKITYYK
jgi:hypothetical protein